MLDAKPLIYAHRGASGYELENSFAAFDCAIDIGADGLEMDCWVSKDGEVVVHHNKYLYPSQNGDPKYDISRLTLIEIRNLPLKNGAPIPTLREIFEKYGSKFSRNKVKQKIHFSIDLQDQQVGEKIVSLVKEFDLMEQVVLCGSTVQKLRDVRKINSDIKLVGSNIEFMLKPRHLEQDGKISLLNLEAFNIQAEIFIPKMKKLLENYHTKLFIWDLHSEHSLRHYLKYSPSAIYSNYPDVAQKILKQTIYH